MTKKERPDPTPEIRRVRDYLVKRLKKLPRTPGWCWQDPEDLRTYYHMVGYRDGLIATLDLLTRGRW